MCVRGNVCFMSSVNVCVCVCARVRAGVLFAVLLLFVCVLVRVCVEVKLRVFVCVCFWGVSGAGMYLCAATNNVGHVGLRASVKAGTLGASACTYAVANVS
jgi:hypothetical protein